MPDAYWSNSVVTLYQGDCREVLAGMEPESTDCVITSPPYWGLRDYSVEPSIWDSRDGCEHEWGQELPEAHKIGADKEGSGRSTKEGSGSGRVCHICSAWRGSLGLEPTPELYVQHLVQIFQEVRRVLKPSGTVWLNMGDSYAGSWGDSGNRPERSHITGRQRQKNTQWFKREGHPQTGRPVTVAPPGLKPKDLVGVPWRVAFALQADGWWLRSDIIWHKPNPMPESVTDRPTKSHEYVFLLSKRADYYYDADAIREVAIEGTDLGLLRGRQFSDVRLHPAWHAVSLQQRIESGADSRIGNPSGRRNRRTVWIIRTEPYPEAHFATFPEALAEPCILAGTAEKGNCSQCGMPWERVVEHTNMEWTKGPKRMADAVKGRTRMGGTQNKPATNTTIGWEPTCSCDAPTDSAVVLDPFAGSGTTGVVAQKLGRKAILIELSKDYSDLAVKRLESVPLPMKGV